MYAIFQNYVLLIFQIDVYFIIIFVIFSKVSSHLKTKKMLTTNFISILIHINNKKNREEINNEQK